MQQIEFSWKICVWIAHSAFWIHKPFCVFDPLQTLKPQVRRFAKNLGDFRTNNYAYSCKTSYHIQNQIK